MAHPKNTRDKVRQAYVYGRLSLEVAAMTAGVAYGTARRWKAESAGSEEDWDKEQAAQLLSDGSVEEVARQMLAGLVRQYQSTMAAIETDEKIPASDKVKLLASLADAYNKTIASSKRILPKTQELAIAKGLVTQLAAFVKQSYPQHTRALAEILVPFGKQLAKFYAQQDKD